jgi:hypothetical protein
LPGSFVVQSIARSAFEIYHVGHGDQLDNLQRRHISTNGAKNKNEGGMDATLIPRQISL